MGSHTADTTGQSGSIHIGGRKEEQFEAVGESSAADTGL